MEERRKKATNQNRWIDLESKERGKEKQTEKEKKRKKKDQ